MNDDNFYLGPKDDGYQCDEPLDTIPAKFKTHTNNESLYPTSHALESIIPKCYFNVIKMNPPVNYLHEETLLYIFYNCPGDNIQLEAFKALVERKYFFHVKMNFFVTFVGDKIADGSKRKVTVFDCYTWTKECIEIIFDKEFVDQLRS
ncbi:hypothetical protein COBT_001071 [Conglomerata obtusa]